MTYYTKQELKLTIENTEELYNAALEVTDFELHNNQISNLMSAALRQINKNTGEPMPTYHTDHEVMQVKDWVRGIVRDIKSEA